MNEIFSVAFMENLKVLFVGLIIYAIIFATLKKIDVFGSEKVNSMVALLSAVIVSFTGIVTYTISYAINWFVILFFIVFLLMVILMFLGVKGEDIASLAGNNAKLLIIVFLLLFSIILVKGFFGVNNQFDIEKDQGDYDVDTSANYGVSDNIGFFSNWNFSINNEMLQIAIFLFIIGLFVIYIGR